jgi:quercetin dioxygenase-like cupin family protein
MFEEIKTINEFDGFEAYDCDNVYFFDGKKGSIASDHKHNYPDIVFLLKGEVELIVGTETHRIKAPKKITIPPNVYHKFTALTNVTAIETKLD